jgi:hypothetical protein
MSEFVPSALLTYLFECLDGLEMPRADASLRFPRTQTRLVTLAARRVQSKIDAALRAAKSTANDQTR